jgi:hypothetical protein
MPLITKSAIISELTTDYFKIIHNLNICDIIAILYDQSKTSI